MIRLALFVITLAIGSVCFTSCKRVKVAPPGVSTLDTLLVPPISTINIPVHYRVSAVEDLINEKIQGTFVKKWMVLNEKRDSLYLEVSRERRIQLSREDRTLIYSIPLKVSGKFVARVIGIKVKNAAPVEAELVLHLATTLHLDPEWNLIPETNIRRIEWIKEPKIKVALVNVNLHKAIENMLEQKETQIIEKADETLKQLLKTRMVVQKLWMDIQKPIRINRKGAQVWLKARGEGLTGFLEKTEPDLISLSFQLKAYTETIVEGDSIPPSNPTLPPFERFDPGGDSLVIFVHSKVEFDKVNSILNQELRDKKLEAQGFSTSIKELEVYGTPSGIAVQVEVKGDVDGKVYLSGTPHFDSLTYMFRIKDFGLTIDAESSIINTAGWLLNTTLADMIAEKLEIDAKPFVTQLPTLIMQGVEKGRTGEKIDIHIDTLVLTPQHIITTRDNIQTIVRADGRASIDLDKKIFEKKKTNEKLNQ